MEDNCFQLPVPREPRTAGRHRVGLGRLQRATASSLLVYLAVACSVGGLLLYNYGLRRVASSVAVSILNLVPVFGAIGAVVINGESNRLAQVRAA